jgi:hypothetical protein
VRLALALLLAGCAHAAPSTLVVHLHQASCTELGPYLTCESDLTTAPAVEGCPLVLVVADSPGFCLPSKVAQ